MIFSIKANMNKFVFISFLRKIGAKGARIYQLNRQHLEQLLKDS